MRCRGRRGPFDSGVTYRRGARFGPHAVRNATRLLRSYHLGLDVRPFAAQQVADAGDIECNPGPVMLLHLDAHLDTWDT
jgi:arginase family enzyme